MAKKVSQLIRPPSRRSPTASQREGLVNNVKSMAVITTAMLASIKAGEARLPTTPPSRLPAKVGRARLRLARIRKRLRRDGRTLSTAVTVWARTPTRLVALATDPFRPEPSSSERVMAEPFPAKVLTTPATSPPAKKRRSWTMTAKVGDVL